MPTVRLIHGNEDEGLERQRQLESLGYDIAFDYRHDSIQERR